MGMKVNPGLLDQKTLAALKMNNAQLGGLNLNAGADSKRGNDMNPIAAGLSGFHGNNAANVVPNASVLGANPNGMGGYHQVQSNNCLQQGASNEFPERRIHDQSISIADAHEHQRLQPSVIIDDEYDEPAEQATTSDDVS
ncbi:uncharacterized protein LOC120149163 [Hibiscus syriacus]|uniref:uncharacterized protein LOC120149163 n=1 Tax=Hibiscus syriacus TaxID=106335 RepID=UPI0019229FF2|nr:uncharacterized protein LOC120149163 [Hibiscus syriacus]